MLKKIRKSIALKVIGYITIITTTFSGFGLDATMAEEQSCDVNISTVLVGCDFKGLDFSGKTFTGSVISNSDFSGTNLQDAVFESINLTSNTFSKDTVFTNTNLSNTNLSALNLAGINFSSTSFTGANLSGANLSAATFTDSTLVDANLNSANLTDVSLNHTNISNADFTNSDFTNIRSTNVYGSAFALPNNYRLYGGYLFGPKANLSNLNLSGFYLDSYQLSGADFSGSMLNGATLNNATLDRAKLVGTNLNNAYLENTNLSRADLTNADLSWAYLRNTNFTQAKLINIQRTCGQNSWVCYRRGWGEYYWDVYYRVGFEASILYGVKTLNFPSSTGGYEWFCCWWRGYFSVGINLPSGYSNRNGFIIGRGVDLSGISLRGADLSGLNLTGITLDNTELAGANFTNSTVTDANFRNKDLTNANFQSANLTGSDFSGANVTGANFYGANLTGVNLDGALLDGVTFNYVNGTGILGTPSSLPAGWRLINGNLVGQTANLYHANLSGADLSGLDLSYASLYNADLTGANLTGVNLYGANVGYAKFATATLDGVSSGGLANDAYSLPSGWLLRNGYLIGPKANLRSAWLPNQSLRGVDFSGADLTGADLRNSDLNGANFSNAILKNVILEFADLRNVSFRGAYLDQTNLNMTQFYDTDFRDATLIGVTRSCWDWWRCVYWQVNGPIILDNTLGWGLSFDSVNLPNDNVSRAGTIWGPNSWVIRNGILFGPTSRQLSGSSISFSQVDMSGLNLSYAKYSNSDFNGVNLSNTDMSHADLSLSKLIGVNLAGTDLSNANLAGLISKGIKGTPLLPSGWVLLNGTLIGPAASIKNANLMGANLEGLDLSGIDLSNANLTGANLRGTNLTNANLSNANLSGVNLTGANVSSTNIDGVVLDNVIARDLIGSPLRVPTGWILQDGKLGGSISLAKPLISGNVRFGEIVSVTTSSSPTSVNYIYQWLRDGVVIPGAVTSSYQIGIADLGKKLSVRVSASRENFVSASSVSTEVGISNTFEELYDMSVSGQAVKDGLLELSLAGLASFANVSFQVSSNGGSSWQGLTGNSYQVKFSDLGGELLFRVIQSAPGFVTQITEYQAVAVDGAFVLPGYSVGVIDGAKSGNVIQGSPKVGSILKSTKGIWPSGTRVSGFWWSSRGYSLSTGQNYKVMLQDINSTITHIEVGVSPTGETRYRLSSSVEVLPNQFVNSSKPVITGNAIIGSKIKAALSSNWEKGAKYQYQWLSNGIEVSGAVSTSYTVTAADFETSLSVRVCATKVSFVQKCEVSAETAIIPKGEMKVSSLPVIKNSTTRLGNQLTALPGKLPNGSALSYQWLRDGVVIEGQQSDTYVLTNLDRGRQISARVTASKLGFYDLSRTSKARVYN